MDALPAVRQLNGILRGRLVASAGHWAYDPETATLTECWTDVPNAPFLLMSGKPAAFVTIRRRVEPERFAEIS